MIASRWTAVASSYARPEVRRAGRVKLAFRVTLLFIYFASGDGTSVGRAGIDGYRGERAGIPAGGRGGG